MLALLVFFILIIVAETNTQSLEKTILPEKKDGFKMEGYVLWSPSVTTGAGIYQLFTSGWPEKYGLAERTTYSEIVRMRA